MRNVRGVVYENAPHIELALNGVEIISNGSGSHHQLRKLDQRVDLIESATKKSGGCYLYSNQRGCDGGRLYYDGCALISLNGEILKQGEQFSVEDVEVSVAKVDWTKSCLFGRQWLVNRWRWQGRKSQSTHSWRWILICARR